MWDAPNKSIGFSPFELAFGDEVRGLLHLFKEQVFDPKQPGDVLQYVSAGEAARKHLAAHKVHIS